MSLIELTGHIAQKQNITDTTQKMSNCVKGDVGDYINIVGRIASKQCVLGTLKKSSAICGKIDKPSNQTPIIDGDHQFIVVDLVKMYEQIISVDNVNAIVPFTAQSSQVLNKLIEMYAVPTGITISQVTANNISFTALKTQNSSKNINIYAVPTTITVSQVTATVNEEVYNNANE